MTSVRASNTAGLCFDATGTLIEMASSVGEVYAEMALEFGVELPAWRLDDAFGRVMRNAPPRGIDGASADARRQGEMEWWAERVRQTFQAADSTVRFANFPAFAGALFDTYREARRWRSRPGVALTLERLYRVGHPMAVISNFDHRLPELLEAIELKAFFRVCVIPSDVGRRKPDRALFERASAALGRTVRDLTYFGDDDLETLEGIRALGVRAVDVSSWSSFEAIDEWLESPATLTTS